MKKRRRREDLDNHRKSSSKQQQIHECQIQMSQRYIQRVEKEHCFHYTSTVAHTKCVLV